MLLILRDRQFRALKERLKIESTIRDQRVNAPIASRWHFKKFNPFYTIWPLKQHFNSIKTKDTDK